MMLGIQQKIPFGQVLIPFRQVLFDENTLFFKK